MSTMNFNAGPAVAAKTPSSFQQAIFSFVSDTTAGNAIIEAVAGSGKSWTIERCMELVNGSSIFLAFNKSIADELKGRGLNARTFHSLGFMPTLKSRNQQRPDDNKLYKLTGDLFTGHECSLYGAFVRKLVGLAKQMGVGCLIEDTEMAWSEIVAHHALALDSEFATMSRAIEMARELLEASYHAPTIDFDDMLYIPVREGLALPKFDFVFVDEAQDTNAIQRAILRKIMLPHTRIIAVGDPAQAIYGFRGADSRSLDLIAQEFNCTRLPLSITYRCPRAVVEHAQQWVGHIQAAPDAIEGEVVRLGTQWSTKDFVASDLVVCRTTAPLISLAYRMIKDRVPVRIMGREIGAGLKSLINKMNANDLDMLELKLEAYKQREVQKALAKRDERRAEAIDDQVNCILFMIGTMMEGQQIRDLMQVIDGLFSDRAAGTVLATIHKAKGLEADVVYWLNSSLCPARWVKQEWQFQQEVNLCYVATTRAKRTLVLIEERME